jgi:hypothetical protein
MKENNYVESVLIALIVHILLLVGSSFANGGFVKSNLNSTKKEVVNTVSPSSEKMLDYQNQTFRIINNASTTVADTVLHWDGDNAGGVGDSIRQWRGIVVFTPAELDPFVATHGISEVWAWMRSPLAWDSILVEIYEGVSINPAGPSTIALGNKVYSQDITAEITSLDDWAIHTLTSPVPLQSGEVYAAVIFIDQNQSSPPAFPLGVDAGPMVPERGGWIWDPTLPNGAQLADFGFSFNWNIRMGLSAAPSSGCDTVLVEGFEGTFSPAGWQKLSPDGGTGWDKVAIGTTPVPGWMGGTVTGPPHGGNSVAFCTWNTGGSPSNDQWLVTPQITAIEEGDSLHFWLRYWPDDYADTVDVRISTTGGGDPANFTVLVDMLTFGAGSDTNWVKYSYRVADFVNPGSDIYIAFREHVTDNLTYGASISLDNLLYCREDPLGIGDNINLQPDGFTLHQNYPNPFNPTTTISYDLSRNADVTLKIYNMTGQEIKTLVNEKQSAGTKQGKTICRNQTSGLGWPG